MELFLRQQFELLLQDATGNFAERTVYRSGGPEQALAILRDDPEAAHRSEFVQAFFQDNLLDNPAGHAFVLEALERRTVPDIDGGTVSDVLSRLARAAFADVLTTMTTQLIQRNQIYS
jgi:hypothetical protein